jgi:hypothetical protein
VLPYIAARTLTSAIVAWSLSSAWVEDGVYTSPDIRTVVQEIINRSGWSSGIAQDQNGGSEARSSKIEWNCWTAGE